MYEELIVFQKKHRDKAAMMLSESFHSNPLFIYLFPDEKREEKSLKTCTKEQWKSWLPSVMFM